MTNRDARSVKRNESVFRLIASCLQLEESMNKLNTRPFCSFFTEKNGIKKHTKKSVARTDSLMTEGEARHPRKGRKNRSLSHLRSRDPPSAGCPRTGRTWPSHVLGDLARKRQNHRRHLVFTTTLRESRRDVVFSPSWNWNDARMNADVCTHMHRHTYIYTTHRIPGPAFAEEEKGLPSLFPASGLRGMMASQFSLLNLSYMIRSN